MSKLAHSNQETMDEIDYQRALEEGNEDLIPNGHKVWRCFHCDQVFTDYHAAQDHFGKNQALAKCLHNIGTWRETLKRARNAGLEDAAVWHDAEAERIRLLALEPDNAERASIMHAAQDDHISHASFIRGLKK